MSKGHAAYIKGDKEIHTWIEFRYSSPLTGLDNATSRSRESSSSDSISETVAGFTDLRAFAFGSEAARSVLLTTIEFEDVVRMVNLAVWLLDAAWDLWRSIWLIKSLNVV